MSAEAAIASCVAWRETQNGWTVSLAEGVSANIQITRNGGVRWNMLLSGAAETIAEAQERLEELASKLGVDAP